MHFSIKGTRRTRIPAVAGLVALGLLAAACGGSSGSSGSSSQSADSGKTYSLRLSSDLPPNAAGGKAEVYFASQVDKLTNGHVKVKVYPLSQLGTEAAVLTGVQTGSIDFADLYTGSVTGQLPVLGLYSLPFLIRSEKGAQALFTSKVTDSVLSSLSSKGLKGLVVISNGPFEVLATKAINQPQDFRGLKLRINTDPISTAMIKAFDGTAVPLPSLQVYSALQQGVVSGTISAPAGMVSLKWYEVAKQLSAIEPQWDCQVFVASPQTMSRLPKNYQQAVLQAADLTSKYDAGIADQATNDNLQALTTNGVQVVHPNKAPFRSIGEQIYAQFDSSIGANNISEAKKVEEKY